MKTIKLIIATCFAIALSTSTFAQSTTKTDTITVYGQCGMCKTRIEKAAKVDGVSKAEWNDETDKLTVVYNPSKITLEAIQKNIAAVGHDTQSVKATDKAYNALPGCCKYERK